MSGTLWLIVEGVMDGAIVREIVKRRYPQVRVSVSEPVGGQPGVSRLAQQIETLIQQALKRKRKGDCIAVLHDEDMLVRPHDRGDYQRIETVCTKYAADVVRVPAKDAIESWLLADEGFCKWLNVKPRNHDNKRKPKDTLISLLDKAGKAKYREENAAVLFRHLDGTGDKLSKSLDDALKHLIDAPCTRQ